MSRWSSFYAFFTFMLCGLLCSISGVIGWEPTGRDGPFPKGRWVEGPLWGQIALGIAFFIAAAIAYRFAARAVRVRAAR